MFVRIFFLFLCLATSFHHISSLHGGKNVYARVVDTRPVVFIGLNYPHWIPIATGTLIHRYYVMSISHAFLGSSLNTVVRMGTLNAFEGGVFSHIRKFWHRNSFQADEKSIVAITVVQLAMPYDVFDCAFLNVLGYRPKIAPFTVSGFNSRNLVGPTKVGHQMNQLLFYYRDDHKLCVQNVAAKNPEVNKCPQCILCVYIYGCASECIWANYYQAGYDSGAGVMKSNTNIVIGVGLSHPATYHDNSNGEGMSRSRAVAVAVDYLTVVIKETMAEYYVDEFSGYKEWAEDFLD